MSAAPAPFCVVGLPNRADYTPSEDVQRALSAYTIFCGGKRHHEIIGRWLPAGHRWLPLRGGVRAVLEIHREMSQPMAIFASGDPLFYGIAGALRTAAPGARVRVLPYFNCLHLLCQRAGIPYADLVATSIHGRNWDELDAALLRGERLIGVLTDDERMPDAIARRLLAYGFIHYTLHIGEMLEAPEEKVCQLTPEQAATHLFAPLNCVILEATKHQRPPLGLDATSLVGLPGRPDMVTKMPVRLTSLAQLDLTRRHCLWDVGFCTGSVSIESRRLFPHLQVIAFERRPECAELLARNTRTCSAPGIVAVMGDFFDQTLASVPSPDAVFIGGHGGRLREMIILLDTVLAPGGRIVINAVLDSTRADFDAATAAFGYAALPPIRLQVDDHNPIAVLGATKPGNQAPREISP